MTCSRDLKLFGSAAHPLRASSLPLLLQCPWSVVMKWLEAPGDISEAADTGSAIHRAIAALHRKEGDPLDVMARCRAAYPLADFREAERHYTAYAGDARNTASSLPYCEQEVALVIPKKGRHREVVINGTLDQIRFDGRRYSLWDVKTGKRSGVEYLHAYAAQLAAYTMAARQTLKLDVHPGGIIRTYGYFAKEPAVFFTSPLTVEDCDRVLELVADAVYAVRAYKPRITPGGHCGYCPASGLANCIPLQLEKLSNGKENAR